MYKRQTEALLEVQNRIHRALTALRDYDIPASVRGDLLEASKIIQQLNDDFREYGKELIRNPDTNEKLTMQQWADRLGISYHTFARRKSQYGLHDARLFAEKGELSAIAGIGNAKRLSPFRILVANRFGNSFLSTLSGVGQCTIHNAKKGKRIEKDSYEALIDILEELTTFNPNIHYRKVGWEALGVDRRTAADIDSQNPRMDKRPQTCMKVYEHWKMNTGK